VTPARGQQPAVGGFRPQLARFLGIARASEEQLFDALILVAERHQHDYELHHGATTLAHWSRQNLDALKPLVIRFGAVASDDPARLRAALLVGTRVGSVGVLQDLQDLSLLAEQCATAWLILQQGGKELRDEELLDTVGRAQDHTRRQLAWLRTQIELAAPEALAVAVDP
jgi:ferredoxin-nitrate reductase